MENYEFFVYILHCGDDSLYTGVTKNIVRREQQHLDGYCETSYTHNRQPTKLVYYEKYQYIMDAIKREKQLKGWSRAKKDALIEGRLNDLPVLSKKDFKKDKK